MSHDSVIKALNALSKTRVFHIEMSAHLDHLFGETDRVAIILMGSTLEHVLTELLQAKMPSLNSDEMGRIFGPEGPLGSFSNKIRISQGLGIIDRPMARRLDICRAMRNAAAHCVTPVSFEDDAFRDAVIQIFSPATRPTIETLTNYGLRAAFCHQQSIMSRSIGLPHNAYGEEETLELIHSLVSIQEEMQQQSSPGKPEE